jgi:hypothetical protein
MGLGYVAWLTTAVSVASLACNTLLQPEIERRTYGFPDATTFAHKLLLLTMVEQSPKVTVPSLLQSPEDFKHLVGNAADTNPKFIKCQSGGPYGLAFVNNALIVFVDGNGCDRQSCKVEFSEITAVELTNVSNAEVGGETRSDVTITELLIRMYGIVSVDCLMETTIGMVGSVSLVTSV